MRQKGFINIILVIIVVALIGAGAYFVATRQIALPTPTPTPNPAPTPSPVPTPLGQACGGFITNPKTCPAGYHCYSTKPDIGGICVLDSKSTPPPAVITPPPSPTPPSPKPSPSPQADFMLDETSNNTILNLSVEQSIELVLHSTYWQIDGSSNEAVVSENAQPIVKAAPMGSCVPGVGCGTVQVTFTTRHSGTAHISASRTICGEALACRPDQRTFSVTVIVQ